MSSRKVDHRRVENLRKLVLAARDEINDASAFYEAWKPMVYDPDLHRRMGQSYATNTFLVIRETLRREMILCLVKLWDRQDNAISMERLLHALEDPILVAHYAERTASQCEAVPEDVGEGLSDVDRLSLRTAFLKYDQGNGQKRALALREEIQELVGILKFYAEGDGSKLLDKLIQLRNKHIAHRDLKEAQRASAASADDVEVDQIYSHMLRVVRIAMNVCVETDYVPELIADDFARNAYLFWAAARGEKTDGHPNYKPMPVHRLKSN